MINLIISLVIVALQSAAPASGQSPQAEAPSNNPTYVVGATDVLTIRVLGEPDLTNNYTVDADGTITFPFLQRVPVAGRTMKEIEALITKLLDGDYIRKPQVSATIATYRSRSIFVLGEVKQPGRYTIEGQTTLLEVIAQAGSFTVTAGPTMNLLRYKEGITGVIAGTPVSPGDPRAAEVMRINLEDLREGRLQANVILQYGDTLFVPQADLFYVTGFVRTPGQYQLRPNMSVQQAIAAAGGLTDRGSDRRIKILRKVNGKDIEVDANMTDTVRPNDTIKVPQRRI
jgi:polysaccharide export outer membrane protein